jgi:hypothetical protein
VTITQILRRAGLAVGLLAAISCDSGPMEVQWSDGLHALFIGNSITYWHDIPNIVAAMADSAGLGPGEVESRASGGWTLKSHWNSSITRNLLERGGWDVIVLQGYTGVGETSDSLLKYAQFFAAEASAVGARTALFMRNPADLHREQIDEIVSAYADAARQTNSVLLPVAAAWEEVWARDSTYLLYDDDVHPNEAGSYLAALVIFQHLTGRSPIGLPAALRQDRGWFRALLELPQDEAEFLQSVAAEVGRRYGAP